MKLTLAVFLLTFLACVSNAAEQESKIAFIPNRKLTELQLLGTGWEGKVHTLRGTKEKVLDKSMFTVTDYKTISTLLIEANGFDTIADYAFSGFLNLRHLYFLNNDNLTTIEEHAFDNSARSPLTILKIKRSKKLRHLPGNLFDAKMHMKLETLSITYCGLEDIDEYMIKELATMITASSVNDKTDSGLSYLYFNNNHLTKETINKLSNRLPYGTNVKFGGQTPVAAGHGKGPGEGKNGTQEDEGDNGTGTEANGTVKGAIKERVSMMSLDVIFLGFFPMIALIITW